MRLVATRHGMLNLQAIWEHNAA